MKTIKYNIVLHSQIGKRKGYLSVNLCDDFCEGKLFIMENINYFCGKFSEGKWHLLGNIKTSIWSTDYEACGEFSDSGLDFEMIIFSTHYRLTGTAEVMEALQ